MQRYREAQSKYKLKLDKRSKEETDARQKLEEAKRSYEGSVLACNAALADIRALKDDLALQLTVRLLGVGFVSQDLCASMGY